MEFEAFDSLDEMLQHLHDAMDAADARVQPWQAAIKTGDYFQRDSGYGFDIYGEVLSEEKPREPHVRHYRLCQCFSIACPEGEVGDVHVSSIDSLLTSDGIEQARRKGWHT